MFFLADKFFLFQIDPSPKNKLINYITIINISQDILIFTFILFKIIPAKTNDKKDIYPNRKKFILGREEILWEIIKKIMNLWYLF